jgi:H+/Cl- antiporter ClcA
MKVVLESAIVGFFTGFLIVGYRFLIDKSFAAVSYVFKMCSSNRLFIPVWILCFIIAGLVVGVIVKRDPIISGSGIPQLEGALDDKISMNWWRVLIGKFVGGIICLAAGLSLGREGPSVQMGSAVGMGFSKICKRIKLEEKYLITSGASAGLAAAFNAPIAGMIFALEEVHKKVSPKIMMSAFAASITAAIVSKSFFGLQPMFSTASIKTLPLSYYAYLIGLGIILGVLGVLFNKALYKSQDIYASFKNVPIYVKTIVPFLLASVLWILLPQVLGGGEDLVNDLLKTQFTFKLLIIILIVKFLFTMVSYSSSVPGGIFLPLLAIGAVIGMVYGNVAHTLFGFSSIYEINLIVLSMAAYFAAIVKAPITGTMLLIEMTGSFSSIMPMAVVCLLAYIVSDILNSKPVYEELLERMLENKKAS